MPYLLPARTQPSSPRTSYKSNDTGPPDFTGAVQGQRHLTTGTAVTGAAHRRGQERRVPARVKLW